MMPFAKSWVEKPTSPKSEMPSPRYSRGSPRQVVDAEDGLRGTWENGLHPHRLVSLILPIFVPCWLTLVPAFKKHVFDKYVFLFSF